MLADLRLGRWQDVLRDIPDGSVRLILSSPPYDNARSYEGQHLEEVDFGRLGAFALRVLEPGGVLAMVLDGAINDCALSITPFRVACEWARLPGWHLHQVLAYGRHGTPGEYKGRFRRDHEPLWVWHKEGPIACNKDAIAERARNHASAKHHRWNTKRDGSRRDVSLDRDVRQIRHRGSIWDYGPVGHGHDPSASMNHPATFAEAFARDAITVWTNKGDLVVDPFSGSGTVGRACIDLGRRFIGAEFVETYYREARQRLAQGALAL